MIGDDDSELLFVFLHRWTRTGPGRFTDTESSKGAKSPN
jgi:hypothetical protein